MAVFSWLASLVLLCLPTRQEGAAPPALVLRDVSVLDVERGALVPGRALLVQDGRVARIAPAAELVVPAGAQLIEGRGRCVIPGLMDLHVHLYEEHDPEDLWLYLAHGVTTVRSMHGGPYQLGLRARVRAGELAGPRILTTGPTTARLAVRTPEQARAVVAEQKAAGYDAIKMYGDGSDTMSRATYHALIVAAREAGIPVVGHAPRNLPFTAVLEERPSSIDHMEEIVYTDEGLGRVVRPYVDLQFGRRRFAQSPELLARVPDFAAELAPEIADLARRVKAAGLAVTPTLITFATIQAITGEGYSALRQKPELRWVDAVRLHEWSPENARFRSGSWKEHLAFVARYLDANLALQMALTRAFHAEGVPILAGSDSPFDFVVPGAALHDELELLVRAGLSPLEALRAATLVPAGVLGLADSGNVAEGLRADLVLIDGDPLRDIGAARRVEGLVLAGRWLGPEQLRARLAAIEAREARLAPRLTRILAALEAGDAAAVATLWTEAGEDRARLAAWVEDRLNQLGYVHLQAQRLEPALAILRRNTELFARSPNAWDGLGEVLWRLGRPEEALAAYEHVLELDPENENARRMIERIVDES